MPETRPLEDSQSSRCTPRPTFFIMRAIRSPKSKQKLLGIAVHLYTDSSTLFLSALNRPAKRLPPTEKVATGLTTCKRLTNSLLKLSLITTQPLFPWDVSCTYVITHVAVQSGGGERGSLPHGAGRLNMLPVSDTAAPVKAEWHGWITRCTIV